MPIGPGTRLGPYEITARIGAGGMGEVYAARDSRLDRTVAIKVLPADAAADPDRRRRLDREARAVAALNHPHICTLHDVGHQDGVDFLVMERVEGETLADRLTNGALPLDQIFRYGIEIADALDKAHRHGITHRDLKPGNIMIARTGVKVLDFGLAKLAQDQTVTASHVVVGTPAYMAPEQLQGKDADARTDIYALGLVLYEMVTGKRRTFGQALALTEVPPQLAGIVERCVAEDPDDRWQSARDVQSVLEWSRHQQVPVAAPPLRRGHQMAWTIGAAGAVALVAALWFSQSRTTTTVREPITFSFGMPEGTKWDPDGNLPEPSPDGRRIAFGVLEGSGRPAIWVRALDGEPQRIAGTDGGQRPFWSPDGQSLGFFADGMLKRVSLKGGPPQSLAEAPAYGHGTWSPSGDIVFSPANRTPLMRVSAAGGQAQMLTMLDVTRQENSHRHPRFLPDGRRFLFTARSSLQEDTAVYVGSLDSSEVKRVLTAQSNAVYVPPGYLLFGRDGALMARRFDLETLEATGEAVPIAGDVAQLTASSYTAFSASADGSVVAYYPSDVEASELTWFDRDGANLGLAGMPGRYRSPRLSPDATRFTVEIDDPQTGNRDLWIVDSATGVPTRRTINPANDWNAVWSPDGTSIAFASDRTPRSSIFLMPADGSSEETLLVSHDARALFPQSWSSDGRLLAYFAAAQTGSQGDVWMLPLVGDRQPRPWLESQFDETFPRFSPDSQWLTYASDTSGADEIYIRRVDGSGERRVSRGGGYSAQWRADGRELFFMAPGGNLMAADVTPGAAPTIAAPKVLFRACTTVGEFYAPAPDGQRFLFVCPSERTDVREVTVLVQSALAGLAVEPTP